MPIHDWTRVPAGLFHHFHQDWSIEIARTLNRGILTAGYYALVLEPPQTTLAARISTDAAHYSLRANVISVRHPLGEVVALIEIVSPGNKDRRSSLRSLVDKAISYLHRGVNLLLIDLFPPSQREPQGIHHAICEELGDVPFTVPPGKPLALVSYETGDDVHVYLEPLAVGDALPDMPLFLAPGAHVLVPLETTYRATWEVCPKPIRELVGDSVVS